MKEDVNDDDDLVKQWCICSAAAAAATAST